MIRYYKDEIPKDQRILCYHHQGGWELRTTIEVLVTKRFSHPLGFIKNTAGFGIPNMCAILTSSMTPLAQLHGPQGFALFNFTLFHLRGQGEKF